jgi:hypothetical protein
MFVLSETTYVERHGSKRTKREPGLSGGHSNSGRTAAPRQAGVAAPDRPGRARQRACPYICRVEC